MIPSQLPEDFASHRSYAILPTFLLIVPQTTQLSKPVLVLMAMDFEPKYLQNSAKSTDADRRNRRKPKERPYPLSPS